MTSMKKRAQSAKNDQVQDVYSCTNQEVLAALFIGIGGGDASADARPGMIGNAAIPGVSTSPGVRELSEDSSAEEDDDLLRQHERIMKQQEFEQLQRDGYIQQRDSSRLNQLDNSSRHNLLESGSLQMQNSTSSPNKSQLESSPGGQTTFQGGVQPGGSFKGTSSSAQNNIVNPAANNLHHQNSQSYSNGPSQQQNQMTGTGSTGPLFMVDQIAAGAPNNIQTPSAAHNAYDLQALGNSSFRARGSSKGSKRGRPISAYPVPGSYPGFLSQISESVESTQASHLSRFTHHLARNNASRKHYVPHNIETFEKEKLYTETISLKKQRNDTIQQNTLLKTHLKAMETDLRKKDGLITQLTNEIKMNANQQASTFYPFAGVINQGTFMNTPPELQGLNAAAATSSGAFHGSRHSKTVQSQLKNQQLIKQNADFRKRIKELKCDVALKETEVQNLQRTLKFTKIKEFEIQLATYSQEILRLKGMLMNERAKPRVDPAQYAALQNQFLLERQQMQQVVQQSEQQRQDIEKLTQANGNSKQKLVKCKTKLKKLINVKKRQDTKIKVMEQKLDAAKNEAVNRSTIKGARGSVKGARRSNVGGKANGYPGDSEMHDQLQTQLEINQILIDKLDSMGVDVRELIRSSQSQNPDQINGDDQQNVRMVVFTFVGPEGLIEGGDNQQFEMPIDFNQVQEVEQIKEILKKELVMDSGIDLILREKQSGQVLEHQEDIHIAVDSGEGILVQFIENEGQGPSLYNENGEQMANINEEDEKSEYSDEQFDEEEDGAEEEETEPQATMIPRITLKQVEKGLKTIRLLFMIKKVPRTHMAKYVLKGEQFARHEETGEEIITTKSLQTIFERKFNFGNSKATKMARFFIEGPPEGDEDAEIAEQEHSSDRLSLIARLNTHVSPYMLYNSLALESMLSRLQGIMSGKTGEFLEDLNLDDEDSNGYLPFEQIQKVWKYSGLPSLDEELTEFLEFLALRASPSLKKVSQEEFCKVFDDGFTLEDCQHDDETPFDAAEEDTDEQDSQAIKQQRQAREAGGAGDMEASGDQEENAANNGEEEEPEIESDDLMLFIDEALNKIISKLPENKKKTELNKKLLPLARMTTDQARNEAVLVLQPQVFIQFMVQTLGISFSDKELYCLLHILVRESENPADASQNLEMSNANNESLNQTQDNAGYILYRDVYTLVRNYLRKQKIMRQSIDLGLDYRVLTKVTFDFLLRIKQVLNGPEDKQKQSSPDKQQQSVEAQNFREVFAKNIVQKKLNTKVDIDLIEFDDFFDGLFMKFKIMCPPKDTMDQLKLLLCVQFGPNVKEPSFFLVQKIERVLYDLDYVYVNLVKILREPHHEREQQEAVKRLKQRYDFVARGISKSTENPAAKKQVSVAPDASDAAENARSGKGKVRPMSSKPRNKAGGKDGAEAHQAADDFGAVAEEEDMIMEDEAARLARKETYARQQTKDIGFDLPVDDDDDDEGDDDDEVEDDFEEEEAADDIEDDVAQPMNSNQNRNRAKKQPVQVQNNDDDIDDDYSDAVDDDMDPPIQETKTLKKINDEAGRIEDDDGLGGYQIPMDSGDRDGIDDDASLKADQDVIDDEMDGDAFVEEDILDDYD